MADEFDIDLHPVPRGLNSVSVNQFELESLYDTHRKTCVQLEASKVDCEVLQRAIAELRAKVEELNLQLRLKSEQLEEEKAKVTYMMQMQLLTQQVMLASFCVLGQSFSGRSHDVVESSTQTQPEESTEGERPGEADFKPAVVTEENQEVVRQRESEVSATEADLMERLRKMEALYDMVQVDNKSKTQQIRKLTSKLKLLTAEEDNDTYTGENITIRKQGRFVVQKRPLECEQCHQVFMSRNELETSTCFYHPMHAVPQDSPNGRKHYWLCCSAAVSGKGQSNGCHMGKHRLNLKRLREE